MSRKHSVDKANAKAVKCELTSGNIRDRLPNDKRKTKPRFYKKRICPLVGCSKVVVRLDNHLRAKHKIKNDKKFKSLIKEAITYNEFSDETDDESSDSSGDEISELKNILKTGGKQYLKAVQDMSPVDSENSSDYDWLEAKVCSAAEDKERKERLGKIIPSPYLLRTLF